MDRLDFPKIQRTAFKAASLPSTTLRTGFDQSDEKPYWLSKTPYERLEAVELMRQIIYGYDPSLRLRSGQAAGRLQRVLEITRMG